ncbi:hypothetical protein FB45DRAFT_871837 [Roridomyces roridus]|uniref:Secreted protein n=1 Tax=Roridomyces roridus TaxID=1738132 RepID=A0AAD7BG11_9AGAR|nr:hypothetical protein FB45DRAFT_871837 [Roridomyces roridus]
MPLAARPLLLLLGSCCLPRLVPPHFVFSAFLLRASKPRESSQISGELHNFRMEFFEKGGSNDNEHSVSDTAGKIGNGRHSVTNTSLLTTTTTGLPQRPILSLQDVAIFLLHV